MDVASTTLKVFVILIYSCNICNMSENKEYLGP